MGMDVETLRSKLRTALGKDKDDLPDPDADLLLNQSYWEILDKYPFREKEVRATFQTIGGTRSYNVPVLFEALQHLSILDPSLNKHVPLDQMGKDVYEQKYEEASTSEGLPTHYIREGKQIILWPTPDQAYTITMRYWTVLADIGTGNNPQIPQSWHEIILYGATWRGFGDMGDWKRASVVKNFQANLIESAVPVEAKEEIDTRRAGLEVLRQDYP